jgi:sigma-54 dependent transcriptional regulator, acetoin dehydrogenase operon transcriptional activator AcoR
LEHLLSVTADCETHDLPGDPGVDPGRLERTALAVLAHAADDLVDTPFSLVLTDERARVIERIDGNPDLAADLDRIRLAPGYRWSEECVAEALAHMACAATPIIEPRQGRPIGVVALVCDDDAATELMLSYVRRIGREIEGRLLDDASAAERTLMAHFVRVRRHARGAIVSVNERTMITNAAAARLVDESDRSTLWEWGRRAVARGDTGVDQLRLSTGMTVTVRCEPVESATETVGVLVQLDARPPVPSAPRRQSRNRPKRQTFGWASLSPSQLGIAELVASGLTNQEVAARLYLSRHTIDFHLREIFSKLGIDSRVKLARLVSERGFDQQPLAS